MLNKTRNIGKTKARKKTRTAPAGKLRRLLGALAAVGVGEWATSRPLSIVEGVA
jgi:hypothetical protein